MNRCNLLGLPIINSIVSGYVGPLRELEAKTNRHRVLFFDKQWQVQRRQGDVYCHITIVWVLVSIILLWWRLVFLGYLPENGHHVFSETNKNGFSQVYLAPNQQFLITTSFYSGTSMIDPNNHDYLVLNITGVPFGIQKDTNRSVRPAQTFRSRARPAIFQFRSEPKHKPVQLVKRLNFTLALNNTEWYYQYQKFTEKSFYQDAVVYSREILCNTTVEFHKKYWESEKSWKWYSRYFHREFDPNKYSSEQLSREFTIDVSLPVGSEACFCKVLELLLQDQKLYLLASEENAGALPILFKPEEARPQSEAESRSKSEMCELNKTNKFTEAYGFCKPLLGPFGPFGSFGPSNHPLKPIEPFSITSPKIYPANGRYIVINNTLDEPIAITGLVLSFHHLNQEWKTSSDRIVSTAVLFVGYIICLWMLWPIWGYWQRAYNKFCLKKRDRNLMPPQYWSYTSFSRLLFSKVMPYEELMTVVQFRVCAMFVFMVISITINHCIYLFCYKTANNS